MTKQNHLKHHIGYWLNRLRTHVHQTFEQRLKRYEVTVAQWCILIALYDQQAQSIKELSDYIEIDKASVSRVVERLVRRKLVKHMSGKDRRSGLVKLTNKGRVLVPLLIQEATENESQFFGCLTVYESEHFQNIVNKIFTNIPSITLEGWLNLKEENTMSDIHSIKTILEKSKNERWPYPKTFDALKEAGVQAYEVNLAPFQAIYEGKFGHCEEPAPPAFREPVIHKHFHKEGIISALKRHQCQETTYAEFLEDMAASGMARYSVNMANRYVTYYGHNPKEYYREEIPPFSC